MFTVGYGDIAPRDTAERVCSIFAIVTGCMFYSFIIGNVTAQIYYVENNEAQYQHKMQDIQAFLEARKVKRVSTSFPTSRVPNATPLLPAAPILLT